MRKIIFVFLFVASIFFCRADIISKINENIEKKDFATALSQINTSLEEDKKNRVLYELRGDIFFSMKEYDRALKDYKKSYQLSFDEETKNKINQKFENVKNAKYQIWLSNYNKTKNYFEKKIDLQKIKTDERDYTVIDFNKSFKFQKYGRNIIGPSSFTVAKNNILVIDNNNFSIKIFDKKGIFLKEIGKQGNSNGGLSRPVDIVFNQEYILLTDMYKNNTRLIKYDLEGNVIIDRKLTLLDQIDSMRVDEKGYTIIKGVKDNNRKNIKIHDNNIDSVDYYWEDLFVEPVYGNLVFTDKDKLSRVFQIKYNDKMISRAIIYSDSKYIILNERVFSKKIDRDYYFFDNIIKMDLKGNIIDSFSIKSELAGNVKRIRRFYFDNENNDLYLSGIYNNSFKLLKFKVF